MEPDQASPALEPALDAEQRRVVGARRSTLMLGAAGTGKSTALRHATARLARELGAHRVVGVAADRAAARAWQGEVARLLAGAAPPVTTVAGLAQQVVTGSLELGVVAGRMAVAPLDEPQESAGSETLRTLTAPEQEMRIREILLGTVASGSVDWPPEWKPALATRTFARQLRRAVAHARRWGWEPEALCREAQDAGDQGWLAVGQFLDEYLQVLDWEGALDYSELALRALRRCEARPAASDVVLVVDDAHDLDPTQRRFLSAMAGGGYLIAAGDPDQCVASYRGADLSALVGLAGESDVVVAGTVYRGGSRMRDARRQLLGRRWYAGLPVTAARDYRAPAVAQDRDRIAVVEYDDEVSQARHIAARLRAAHRSGTAWRDMAVLVVRPSTEIAALTRCLGQARIPVHVPMADVALVEHPAVATLLAAARLVLAADPADPRHDEVWQALLTSDMAAVPARHLRELRRRAARSAPAEPQPSPGTEPTLIELGRDPVLAQDLPAHLADAVRAIGSLERRIGAARQAQRSDAPPAQVLWRLWHGGDDRWPQRLRRRALGAGEAAIAAGRGLDAVIQIFRLAERAPERWGGHRGLASLVDELAHQEIPAEPDLKQEARTDTVAVLSLHRALGRCWPMVVVTGLQESNWSAGQGRDGLIQPGRLTGTGLLPESPRRAAAEQRRLLNSALARSTESLLLASCGGPDDPPTALLGDAGLRPTRVRGVPEEPQTPLDVFLRARRTAVTAGGTERVDATRVLHRLVTATAPGDEGPMFPGMAVARWQGASEWTVGTAPLRPPDVPLALSGSAVSLLDQCQLRWLLQRELKGDRQRGNQAQFGLVVHAAAAALAGDPDRRPEDALAEWWGQVDYDAAWHGEEEHGIALDAVRRAQQWLATRPVPVLAEQRIDTVLPIRDESGARIDLIRLTGSADVVEPHDDHVLVWDYKTQRSAASQTDAAENVQLAVYQLALADMFGVPAQGAGLVHLCVPEGTAHPTLPKVRPQPAMAEREPWGEGLLRDAAAAVRDERFRPVPGTACRTCPFTASCPAHQGSGGAV